MKGTCNFSREECWYLHEEGTNTETNLDINVICNICRNMFMTKRDLMEHKKINHPLQVPANKSKQGKGVGSTDESLNHQSSKTTTTTHTYPATNAWDQPLSSVQKKDFCQHPPATAPDQEALLNALQVLTQRLQALETRMFPEQH